MISPMYLNERHNGYKKKSSMQMILQIISWRVFIRRSSGYFYVLINGNCKNIKSRVEEDLNFMPYVALELAQKVEQITCVLNIKAITLTNWSISPETSISQKAFQIHRAFIKLQIFPNCQ